MAQNDLLRRYLDAGMAFTAMTQARAEAIVKDLVKAGEVQADQAREVASELFERSRRNTERFTDSIRKEVRSQLETLDVVRRTEFSRLEQRIAALTGRAATTTKSTAKKATSKASTAKKSAARKSAAKKSTAKKAAAKKSTAKKSTAKKTTAKKSTAAKKSAAKKSAKRAG